MTRGEEREREGKKVALYLLLRKRSATCVNKSRFMPREVRRSTRDAYSCPREYNTIAIRFGSALPLRFLLPPPPAPLARDFPRKPSDSRRIPSEDRSSHNFEIHCTTKSSMYLRQPAREGKRGDKCLPLLPPPSSSLISTSQGFLTRGRDITHLVPRLFFLS